MRMWLGSRIGAALMEGGRVVPLGAPLFPLQLPRGYTVTTPAPMGVALDPVTGEPVRVGVPVDPKLCNPVGLGLPVWGGSGGDVVIPVTLADTVSATALVMGRFGGPGETFTSCPCTGIDLCGGSGFDGSETGQ